MKRDDINELSADVSEFADAVTEFQEIFEDSQTDGYTVAEGAYSPAQQQAQRALVNLVYDAIEVSKNTGEFTAQKPTKGGGTTEVVISLPDPPLEEGADGLPKRP